jgi:hypothetical protein
VELNSDFLGELFVRLCLAQLHDAVGVVCREEGGDVVFVDQRAASHPKYLFSSVSVFNHEGQ